MLENEIDINRRKVQIKDSYREDAGKGRIRVDPSIIKDLNLEELDAIELSNPKGSKKTVTLLYPSKDEESGSNYIHIDQPTRKNLVASIGDSIEIRKIEALDAVAITFAGLDGPVVVRNPYQLARKLEGRVITRGDIMSFYAGGRRVDLIVIDFTPNVDAVKICIDTKIHLSEKGSKDIRSLNKELEEIIQGVEELIELPSFFIFQKNPDADFLKLIEELLSHVEEEILGNNTSDYAIKNDDLENLRINIEKFLDALNSK